MTKTTSIGNFSILRVGALAQLNQHVFTHAALPFGVEGKKFLKDELGLTSMEVSINKMPPGGGMPFHHRHQESEELYLFIKGKGQFQIDGEIIDVTEGTAIRVAPKGVRVWRNNASEDLYYIVIQAKSNSLAGSSIADGVVVEGAVEWPGR